MQGNTFNGADQLVQLDGSGNLPALDGSALTNLPAGNLTGSIDDGRLSSNVTLQGNTFNGADQLVQLDGSGALPALDGSALTGITATLSGDLTDGDGIADFTYDGSGAASVEVELNGSSLSNGGSGLSLNLGNANAWTGAQTFSSVDVNGGTLDGTVIGGASPTAGTFTNLTASGTVNLGSAAIQPSELDGSGGNNGQVLTSDGSSVSWEDVEATTVDVNAGQDIADALNYQFFAPGKVDHDVIKVPEGQILIGYDGSGLSTSDYAQAYTVSGDITLSSVGVATIGNDKITNAMMSDNSVGNAELLDDAVTEVEMSGLGTGTSGQVLTSDGGAGFAWADETSLEASSVEFTLTDGDGIADFSFDGSADATVSLQLNGTTLDNGASGLSIDLGNPNTWTGAQTFDDVDINGGTIDATAIGATTPSTAKFSHVQMIDGTAKVNVGSGDFDEGFIKTYKDNKSIVTLGSSSNGTKGAVTVGTDEGIANWRGSMVFIDENLTGNPAHPLNDNWLVGAGDLTAGKGAVLLFDETNAAIKIYNGDINDPTFSVNHTGDVEAATFTGDGSGLTGVIAAEITDGLIVDADVDASAAIAGTKIDPDFGAQDVWADYYRTTDNYFRIGESQDGGFYNVYTDQGNAVVEMGRGETDEDYGIKFNRESDGAERAGLGWNGDAWVAAVGDNSNQHGVMMSYSSNSADETRLLIANGNIGNPVFSVDSDGDMLANSITSDGAVDFTGATLTIDDGDLEVADLAAGTDGQVLTTVGGVPTWDTPTTVAPDLSKDSDMSIQTTDNDGNITIDPHGSGKVNVMGPINGTVSLTSALASDFSSVYYMTSVTDAGGYDVMGNYTKVTGAGNAEDVRAFLGEATGTGDHVMGVSATGTNSSTYGALDASTPEAAGGVFWGNATSGQTQRAYGVYAAAGYPNDGDNVGVQALAGNASNSNIALVAAVGGTEASVKSDVSTLDKDLAGYFIGDVEVTGNVTANLFTGDGSGLTNVVGTIENSLIDGNGIADFTYDGSAQVAVEIDLDGTSLTSGADGIAINLGNANTWTGAQTFNTGTTTIETSDINGGAIDGTVIGVNSAAAGTFTDLTATGTIDFTGGTLDVADDAIGVADIEVGAANQVLSSDGSDVTWAAPSFTNMGTGIAQTGASITLKADDTPSNDKLIIVENNAGDSDLFYVDEEGDVTATSFNGDGSGLSNVVGTITNALEDGSGIADFTYDGGSAGVQVAIDFASVNTWTGAQTFNVATTTIADIDVAGGEIDGTVIGANSAAAGSFTDLTADGTIDLTGGTVNLGTDAVQTAEIQDAQITNAKIAADAVSEDEMLNLGTGTSGQVLKSDGGTGFTWSDYTFASMGTGIAAAGASLTLRSNGDGTPDENLLLIQNNAGDSDLFYVDEEGDATMVGLTASGAVDLGTDAIQTAEIADNQVTLAKIADGAADQMLTTDGSNNPQWEDKSAVTVGFATDVAGGAANQLLYQTGAGATDYATAGTAGQMLLANGSQVPTFTTMSGDATIIADGTVTISPDAVSEDEMLNLGTGTSGQVLKSDGGTGFTWSDYTFASMGTGIAADGASLTLRSNGDGTTDENLLLIQNNAGDSDLFYVDEEGDVTATSFNGDGSALTGLTATNLTGTIDDGRLSANVTLQGNTFNGADQLVQLDGSGNLPALDGSALTNVNAATITDGLIVDADVNASADIAVSKLADGTTENFIVKTDGSGDVVWGAPTFATMTEGQAADDAALTLNATTEDKEILVVEGDDTKEFSVDKEGDVYIGGQIYLPVDGRGSAGQVLSTNGTDGGLSWTNAPAATSVANLEGGAGGSVPYQSSAGSTSMLAIGTAGQVMVVNGAGTAPAWGTIGATAIDADAVTAAKIAADAVTASAIATGAVDSDEIAADAVTASEIAADAVTASEIATGAVDSDEIAADAVTASEIATGAVGSDELAAEAVTTAKISDDGTSAGQYLKSLGAGNGVQWDDISTANLEGGAAGNLVYQSGTDATAFVGNPTSDDVVCAWDGSKPAWQANLALTLSTNDGTVLALGGNGSETSEFTAIDIDQGRVAFATAAVAGNGGGNTDISSYGYATVIIITGSVTTTIADESGNFPSNPIDGQVLYIVNTTGNALTITGVTNATNIATDDTGMFIYSTSVGDWIQIQ